MDAETLIQATRTRVDALLDRLLPAEDAPPAPLHQAMRYSCLAPGKRLRPALCLAAARAIGGNEEAALYGAAAVEMVHVFSLIHDDLPAIDDDDLRRGRPTCHKAFGEAIAILAGDALFALAFEALAAAPAPAEATNRALGALAIASGSGGLVGGEVADVLSEGQAPGVDAVRAIHARKTGALIGCACEIGGILAGATWPNSDALRQFGQQVGLAFQITDDVLNETATQEQLGKASLSDRARTKATYPGMVGLDESVRIARGLVADAIDNFAVSGLPADELSSLARYAVERLS